MIKNEKLDFLIRNALCGLDAFAKTCREIENDHGFGTQSPGEDIALMHSELSEALEEIRNGRDLNEIYYNLDGGEPDKPEGVPAELADTIIRILGFCERHNIDIIDALARKSVYNDSRPYRHGGKKL